MGCLRRRRGYHGFVRLPQRGVRPRGPAAGDAGPVLLAECAPDVPLEDVHAICRAYERLSNLPEP